MAVAGFAIPFQDVALTASTAKTVVTVKPASNVNVTIAAIILTFDGVTASNTPVLIEVVKGDATTTGTSTSQTPQQLRGRPATAQSAGAKNYTVEPTTLTQLACLRITPTAGLVLQLPLGREIEADSTTNKMIGLRLTAGASVNVSGWLEVEE